MSDNLNKPLGLETFLSNRDEPENLYMTREIERLISAGRYEDAFEAYQQDTIDEVPADYQEFLDRHIIPEEATA